MIQASTAFQYTHREKSMATNRVITIELCGTRKSGSKVITNAASIIKNLSTMHGIETASRAQFLSNGQRSKSCHAFWPEGIQIEDPTLASCHA